MCLKYIFCKFWHICTPMKPSSQYNKYVHHFRDRFKVGEIKVLNWVWQPLPANWILPTARFRKWGFIGIQPHPFIVLSVADFEVQQQSWVFATKTIWFTKPKLSSGPLQVCQPPQYQDMNEASWSCAMSSPKRDCRQRPFRTEAGLRRGTHNSGPLRPL